MTELSKLRTRQSALFLHTYGQKQVAYGVVNPIVDVVKGLLKDHVNGPILLLTDGNRTSNHALSDMLSDNDIDSFLVEPALFSKWMDAVKTVEYPNVYIVSEHYLSTGVQFHQDINIVYVIDPRYHNVEGEGIRLDLRGRVRETIWQLRFRSARRTNMHLVWLAPFYHLPFKARVEAVILNRLDETDNPWIADSIDRSHYEQHLPKKG